MSVRFVCGRCRANCFLPLVVLLLSLGSAWFSSAAAAEDPPTGQSAKAPAAEPKSAESGYLADLKQITFGYVKAGEGYFSPDASMIVYQAVPQGYPFYQIYLQKLDGTPPHRISTGRGRTTCSYFNPDGKHLIYASSHLDPQLDQTEEAERQRQAEDARTGRRRRYQWDFDPQMDIFACDLDGGNPRQLTHEKGYDAEGSYSPDGRLIVFCSDRDGDPDLYIMDADGGNVRQLTNEPNYDGGPFFSPDGKWIVYRSDRKQEGFLQIHVIGVDGKNDGALTDNVGVNWAPYWHPRAQYIVWTGADHSDPQARPNYDLWLLKYEIRPEGVFGVGKPLRITDHESADVLPVFSPDGKQLMWTSNRGADHASQLWSAEFHLPE
jgi:TolB protein